MSSPANKAAIKSGRPVRFLLNMQLHEVENVPPTTTLLTYLREQLHHTGTKEGCAEGDCGACTVVIAEPEDGQLRFRSVNSCIQFVPTLDGKALFTVEGLKMANQGKLHPVQQAMVDCHGSQCGFCTPGFIMSLFALYKNQDSASRQDIDDALSGNLCRCTGYRPIIDAAHKMYELGQGYQGDDKAANSLLIPGPREAAEEIMAGIDAIKDDDSLMLENHGRYFAPLKLDEFAELYQQNPAATILAGGTDVGLWVTKQYRELPMILYIGNVGELKRLEVGKEYIEIGAAVSLTDAFAALLQHYPELNEFARRFASPPIRNSGTLCGNIANGSPIGDSMPALISLNASLLLRRGKELRELPLDEFYIAYQQTALEQGEFIEAVRIPLPVSNHVFRSYKVSKRFDQDISALCVAIKLEIQDGKVEDIRICYGGMAAIPLRANKCELALKGQDWSENTLENALAELANDFQPLSDMRATSDYRMKVAANLLKRFYLETTDPATLTHVLDYAD